MTTLLQKSASQPDISSGGSSVSFGYESKFEASTAFLILGVIGGETLLLIRPSQSNP